VSLTLLDTSVVSAVLRRRRKGEREAARRGITVTTPDALIAAQALNRRASLFTADDDFRGLVAIAGLQLL
jgi:predicted nucleic acid-binding protein